MTSKAWVALFCFSHPPDPVLEVQDGGFGIPVFRTERRVEEAARDISAYMALVKT